MAYQVLARKWRPNTFESLVGQEHVIKPLAHALQEQRLHQAYLFSGIQGVGKTTIARVIAKCLNCETGITATPCGKCSACQEIDAGKFVDLIEIDAASRTKVEDMRELLENVQYAPTRGRFKIYLIDEVHMLSGHSFNALLKTLEEPPEHVKFLLATTDPQKLPVTVLSRCLQFHLKNLSPERISQHLSAILNAENIPFEEAAVEQIAQSANGSVRDALSLLEQGIAFSQGNLNIADVSQMLGTINYHFIEALVSGLMDHDGQKLLTVVEQLAEQGADFDNAFEELLTLLHKIIVAQIIPEAIDSQLATSAFVLEASKKISKEDAQLFYQIALLGRRDLSYASSYRQGFEMTLLRMLAFRPVDLSTAEKRAEAPQPSVATVAPPPRQTVSSQTPTQSRVIDKPVNTQKQPTLSETLVADTQVNEPPTQKSRGSSAVQIEQWAETLAALQLTGMTYALAANCELQSIQDNQIKFMLDSKHEALLNNNVLTRMNEALSQFLKQPVKAIVTVGTPTSETPAQLKKRLADEKQLDAIRNIESDPVVQEMTDKLGVTVESSLVTPIESE